MSHNKLYTLSYFRKRLHEAGFSSHIIFDIFAASDTRYWMISIGDIAKIICICYKKDEEFHFELSDGKNYIKNNLNIHTQSMNVILDILNEIKNKKE
jgi:hypothetical protein